MEPPSFLGYDENLQIFGLLFYGILHVLLAPLFHRIVLLHRISGSVNREVYLVLVVMNYLHPVLVNNNIVTITTVRLARRIEYLSLVDIEKNKQRGHFKKFAEAILQWNTSESPTNAQKLRKGSSKCECSRKYDKQNTNYRISCLCNEMSVTKHICCTMEI